MIRQTFTCLPLILLLCTTFQDMKALSFSNFHCHRELLTTPFAPTTAAFRRSLPSLMMRHSASGRPSLDDVERISKGQGAKKRGTGSRAVPHRLNEAERKEWDLAKRRGYLQLRGTGYRRERGDSPLANIYRQWCDAMVRPCVVIERRMMRLSSSRLFAMQSCLLHRVSKLAKPNPAPAKGLGADAADRVVADLSTRRAAPGGPALAAAAAATLAAAAAAGVDYQLESPPPAAPPSAAALAELPIWQLPPVYHVFQTGSDRAGAKRLAEALGKVRYEMNTSEEEEEE